MWLCIITGGAHFNLVYGVRLSGADHRYLDQWVYMLENRNRLVHCV